MKRLLVYFSVLVGCLFVGLTTYYMIKNYEGLSTSRADSEVITLNQGDELEILVTHSKKHDDTVVTAKFDKEGVASYDLKTGILKALRGGETVLTIETNNKKLPVFNYNISVGDGQSSTPWFIKSEEDLRKINAKDENGAIAWKLDQCYSLQEDIALTGEWTPIGGYVKTDDGEKTESDIQFFIGSFLGNNHTISNLSITKDAYTGGLFGAIGKLATISSLNLKNVNIKGYYYYVGALAGLNQGAMVERVQVSDATITVTGNSTLELLTSGSYTQDENNVGGLIGADFAYRVDDASNKYSTNQITLCSFDGKINVDNKNINNTAYSIGGLVGYSVGGEIVNNKVNVEYAFSSQILAISDTTKIQVGGLIGSSWIYNPDLENFGENKDKEIAYPIALNNLVLIKSNGIVARMGAVIGQQSYFNINDYSAELQDTVRRINAAIGARTTGNLYNYAGDGKFTANYNGCTGKTIEELKDMATYINQNWEISTAEKANDELKAWTMVDGEVANLNINGATETSKFSNSVIEINSVDEFAYYVRMMVDLSRDDNLVSTPTQKYYLSRSYILNIDIDLSQIADLKTWAPIGFRASDMAFSGTFDGNGHTISNLVINKNERFTSVGLFASLGSKAIVKNLKIENVTIDCGEIAGTIAGVNAGQIENCQIEAVVMNNAIVAGFVAGNNKGLIVNSRTIKDTDTLDYTILENKNGENKIDSTSKASNIYLGGVAGINSGIVSGIRIQSNFTIQGAVITDYKFVEMIGGLVGYNQSGAEISNSSVENANLKDFSANYLYMGGIAGLSNGKIVKCHAGTQEGGLSLSITGEIAKGDHLVGGLVGQLSAGAEIYQSFVNGDVKSYMVGGIGAFVFGDVKECYVKGSLSGEYVGGFAVQLSLSDKQKVAGNVQDCYIKATITGESATSKVAGVATYVVYPANVERCIVSVTFAGKGSKYYESYTDTRTGLYNLINGIAGTKLGTINNIVIDESLNTGDIVKNGGLINRKGQNVFYTNTDTINSGAEFYKDKGFNTHEDGVWKMTAQKYPQLFHLNLDLIEQILTIKEGTYKQDGSTAENGATLELLAGGTCKLTIISEGVTTEYNGTYKNESSLITLTLTTIVEDKETQVVMKGSYMADTELTSITLDVAENNQIVLNLFVDTPEETEEAA